MHSNVNKRKYFSYFVKANSFTDKCSKIKCLNNGVCIVKNGKAECKCIDRYTGNECQTGKSRIFYFFSFFYMGLYYLSYFLLEILDFNSEIFLFISKNIYFIKIKTTILYFTFTSFIYLKFPINMNFNAQLHLQYFLIMLFNILLLSTILQMY